MAKKNVVFPTYFFAQKIKKILTFTKNNVCTIFKCKKGGKNESINTNRVFKKET